MIIIRKAISRQKIEILTGMSNPYLFLKLQLLSLELQLLFLEALDLPLHVTKF